MVKKLHSFRWHLTHFDEAMSAFLNNKGKNCETFHGGDFSDCGLVGFAPWNLVGGTVIISSSRLTYVGLGSEYLHATAICILTISSPYTFQP
jgi:hypothetical protein